MTSISPPRTSAGFPDRNLDCQMAAEFAFQDLLERIVNAGWGEAEAARALAALAENHLLAIDANADTAAGIAAARRKP